jgi:hypothetical protein
MVPQGNKAFLIPAAAGVAVLIALHFFFIVTWQPLFGWAGDPDAWWLSSGYSAVFTVVTLFFVAYVVLSRCRPTLVNAIAMWIGTSIGMVIDFRLTTFHEEQNLWPIALVTGCILTLGAVLLGRVAAAKYGRSDA